MNMSKQIHKADKNSNRLKNGRGTGHKGCWKRIASKAERSLNKALAQDW